MKNKNLLLFVLFIFCLFCVSFFVSDRLDYERYPWHMMPWKNQDSLSTEYLQKYEIQSDTVAFDLKENADRIVFIQVDAWGLPFDESLLEEELSVFKNAKTFIHWRKRNQTKQVELLELNNRSKNGVYFFGGDSLEYGRKTYIPDLGFVQMVLCQNCSDEIMASKLDSALSVENPVAVIAWTAQSSRVGVGADIRKSLKLIADLATKHPDVRFVVQGTHRPILGTPETRKKYYAHWIPVVVLN